MQHNPNLQERFSTNTKQENNKQVPKEAKNTAKEIAEVFSAITRQEISEEEVSLIQNIQLPADDMEEHMEDIEAPEKNRRSMTRV